ncbi:hypothetical protein TNCV_574061 [Trichonephila clavipes]|nr:hypothetical protein TNCV_574061 [Trichonephila clavipes]
MLTTNMVSIVRSPICRIIGMGSFGHQSLPPTNLGRVDEEMVSPGRGLLQDLQFTCEAEDRFQDSEYFQLVPFHAGINGNKKADVLATTAAEVNSRRLIQDYDQEISDCLLTSHSSSRSEDIPGLPLVLARAGLLCPHFRLFGF